MKVVFINNRKAVRKILRLPGWAKVLCSLCLLGVPLTTGVFLGLHLGGGKIGILLENSLEELDRDLTEQKAEIARTREAAQQQVQALSLRLAEMQARLVRLDALGERLTGMADLEDGEFDFSRPPAVGGPEYYDIGAADTHFDLPQLIYELEEQIDNRQNQLTVLESLLVDRELSLQNDVAGMPVVQGWISSGYGTRTDPFTGKKSWHNGVDFAGRKGDAVVAIGPGIVTWSGPYQGYGNLVEINHGDGVITRYAHNKDNSVKVGDLVQRGQVIGSLGSTGRSTGPHVHFEVYKHGRAVDPSTYIRNTLR